MRQAVIYANRLKPGTARAFPFTSFRGKPSFFFFLLLLKTKTKETFVLLSFSAQNHAPPTFHLDNFWTKLDKHGQTARALRSM